MYPLRKKTLILFAAIIFIFFSLFYIGLQITRSRMISPGALFMAYESIYKPGGCKVCHSKGKIVDNDKCNECHRMKNTNYPSGEGLAIKYKAIV